MRLRVGTRGAELVDRVQLLKAYLSMEWCDLHMTNLEPLLPQLFFVSSATPCIMNMQIEIQNNYMNISIVVTIKCPYMVTR